MLISHRHKLIFVRTRKTAGSSIAVSLYRYLGPADIAVGTWTMAIAQGLQPNARMRWWGLRPPGPLSSGISLAKSPRRASRFDRSVKAVGQRHFSLPKKFEHHARAIDIRHRLPTEWSDYLTFTVVRNPFERALSDYNWRTRKLGDARPTFEQYARACHDGDDLGGIVSPMHNAWNFYTDNNNIIVDRICRFEQLGVDLASILSSSRLSWDGWLPNLRRAPATSSKVPIGMSQSTIDMLGATYRHEIDAFGYSPPEHWSDRFATRQ